MVIFWLCLHDMKVLEFPLSDVYAVTCFLASSVHLLGQLYDVWSRTVGRALECGQGLHSVTSNARPVLEHLPA